MPQPHFSIVTLILYVIIGVLGAVFIKSANNNRSIHVSFVRSGEFLFYAAFVFTFVCFALFRKVGEDIGGSDAIRYIDGFENIFRENSRFETQEQLFLAYNKLIRSFTDNYKIYFLFCYSIISFAYVFFIKNFISKNISYIPFVLLIFPFLRSFSSLRSSLAIAVFLIALVLLKNRKTILSYILIFATFFIHRISALFILFIPFYLIYKNRFLKFHGIKLYIFFITYILLGYICARFVQQYVLIIQLAYSSTDLYYLSGSVGKNIFERWPMMFPYILLFIVYIFGYKKLKDDNKTNLLKLFCAFDIIIMPVSLVLGIWRANEYLYVARIIMWGMLINIFQEKFSIPSRMIFNLAVSLSFLSWLIFRICSEWNDLKIMPYILDIQL